MISLVDRNNGYIKTISPNASWVLEHQRPSNAYTGYLKHLKRNDYRIQCRCGLVMHVVFDPDLQRFYLRRNPGQESRHDRNCPFHKPEREKGKQKGSVSAKRFKRVDTAKALLLDLVKDPKLRRESRKQKQLEESTSAVKYASIFNYLFSMIEQIGINAFPNPALKRNSTWDDLNRFFQRTRYEKFIWCPSRACSGGLVGLNRKMIRQWTDRDREPEGLILGLLDEVPATDQFELFKYPGDPYPIKSARIPRHQISVIGTNGPFLFMAVCTPQTDGKIEFAVPRWNRMVMHAIVSHRSLMPVASDYERAVAKRLMFQQVPFVKPLFSVGPNRDLRPDFIVDATYLLQIQPMENGRDSKGKTANHIEMTKFYDLPLVVYDPHTSPLRTIA